MRSPVVYPPPPAPLAWLDSLPEFIFTTGPEPAFSHKKGEGRHVFYSGLATQSPVFGKSRWPLS